MARPGTTCRPPSSGTLTGPSGMTGRATVGRAPLPPSRNRAKQRSGPDTASATPAGCSPVGGESAATEARLRSPQLQAVLRNQTAQKRGVADGAPKHQGSPCHVIFQIVFGL
jgi:hypothetical protein